MPKVAPTDAKRNDPKQKPESTRSRQGETSDAESKEKQPAAPLQPEGQTVKRLSNSQKLALAQVIQN
jgi:hypothetical protein